MRESRRVAYWLRRLSEWAMLGWLGLMLLMDLGIAASMGGSQFLVAGCGIAGIAAVILRRRHRAETFAALLGLSLFTSLILPLTGTEGVPGAAESGALLVLLLGVLRHLEPIRTAAIMTAVCLVVLMTEAITRGSDNMTLAFSFLLFAAWSAVAGAGSYLRFQQERRTEAVHSVRRTERLELARELHDLVAHHITGIVVQAQAARTVAETSPTAVVPALDAIASAGGEALNSMRRMVTVLRADEASRTPGTSLRDLRLLTERFSAEGPKVAFEIGQGLDDRILAPEVLTTLHRVLLEALTNVRKHAPGTGWVEAELRRHDRAVTLRVRNYGSATDPRLARLGGGFGIVGMAERVTALGGHLHAGPTAEGAWEVLAEFPLP